MITDRSSLILALALLGGAPGFLGVATGPHTLGASPGESITVPVIPLVISIPKAQEARVLTSAPVFLLPDASRIPLRSLPTHAVVRVLDERRGWTHVQFEDPQVGERFGYIETKYLRRSGRKSETQREAITTDAILEGGTGGGATVPVLNGPPLQLIGQQLPAVVAPNTAPSTGVSAKITKRSKATPPQVPVGQLPGTIAFGATGFGLTRRNAPEAGMAASFSGKATRLTKVTFSFQRGPTQELAPVYRGVFEQTRLRGQVMHPSWRVLFGEMTARSSAVTGPAVRSNGAAFRWNKGLLVAETTVGQPAAFGQGRGGRLIQANAGVKTSFGTMTMVVSDLFRSATPSGALSNLYNTARALSEASQMDGTGFEQELQPADLQQIARQLSAANRVRGAGVQSELRLFGHHQIFISAGTLWLTNASDQEVSGASAEGRYTFNASRASFNARLRRTPPSVPGVNIPGDELAVDGRATLTDSLKVGGRFFSRSSWTLGRQTPSQTEGQSADIGYTRGRMQVDLRVNYRESEFVRKRTTRTTAVDFAVPLSFLTFEAGAELGSVNDGRVVRPVVAYQGGLTWERQHSSLSVAAGSNDQGLGRLFSAEINGSLNVRQIQFRGGAETSSGGLFGADSQFWAGMELPLTRDFGLVFGVDYASWDDQAAVWGDALATDTQTSPWRGTFGIRRRLTIPMSLFGLQVEPPLQRPGAARLPAGARNQ